MNEVDFTTFLKQNQRKASAVEQIIGLVKAYEVYFETYYPKNTIDETTTESLESYISWYESETGESASKPLWGLRYYFDFIEDQKLSDLAGELRAARVKRKPFFIKNIRGINPDHLARLDALYLENIDQVIDAGRTPRLRQELSGQTGIPLGGILEFVKLCDLARLNAVGSVRARLYHDAGLTPEIIAAWEPEALRAMLITWIDENSFDGIPPQPKEVERLVNDARLLPKIVVY